MKSLFLAYYSTETAWSAYIQVESPIIFNRKIRIC